MKRQIRRNIFETNSSSTHSLIICSEEEFKAWEKGEIYFDEYGKEKFISNTGLNEYDKEMAEMDYEKNKNKFQKNWRDLSKDAKQEYYLKYAKENGIINENIKTYEEYMDDYSLETFVQRYISKSGDKIVVFGKYGID